MQLRLLRWRKKLDRGEDARPLVVPSFLLSLVVAPRLSVPPPLEFGLTVLAAYPDRLPPPRRVLDEPDNVVGTTLPATASLEGTAAQRHGKLGAGRITGARLITSAGCGCVPASRQLAPMRLAPAPHGGRVAGGAIAATEARTSFAAGGATEADKRQRSWEGEIVEIVEIVGWPRRHENRGFATL